MSVNIRKYALVLALIVLVVLMGIPVGKSLFQNSPWYVTPEETAYQAVIADHPLTGVVEAVEAYTHTLVIGHEYITATEGSDTLVSVWLYFEQEAGEDEFLAVHEAALMALAVAFPDCTDYIVVFAEITYDSDGVLQARGYAATWFSATGATIALGADDYATGVAAAMEAEEAVAISMQAYGYPLLIDPWYPRRDGYTWPIDAEKEPVSDCGCG